MMGSLSAFAFTATFSESDTAYDWSDPTIWDTVPDTGGDIIINGGGTTGSSLNLEGLDLSAVGHHTTLNDAVFNLVGASYNFGANGTILNLVGSSKLYAKDSVLFWGAFPQIHANGTSVLELENTTFSLSPSYGGFFFSDQAQMILKNNTTYSSHLHAGMEFTGSSQFNLESGASFSFVNAHSGEALLTDDSQMNISSGASFSGGSNRLYLEKNAQINLDGVGSTLNVTAGIETRTSEDGTAANVKINVQNGASFTASNLSLTGTSSLNYTSLADAENQTGGAINGLSLVDSTGVNVSGAQTYITASGTLTGTAGTSINISDAAVVEKSGNPVTLAGDIVVNVTEGSRFNVGHNAGLFIQDNAKLVVDASYLGIQDWPVVTASGGELVLKNGATFTGSNTTSTVGRYMSFVFSGDSKLTMQDTSISGRVTGATTFSGSSVWTLDNTTFTNLGWGAIGLQLSDSAALVLKNSSSLTWPKSDGTEISATGSSKIDISGSSTLSAYRLSVGGGSVALSDSSALRVEEALSVTSGSLVVSGASTFSAYELKVGSPSGASTFEIRGDSNEVVVTSMFGLIGAIGTSFANQQGGKLLFVANEYGLSTLQVNAVSEFSGLVELDFSNFREEGTFEYLLISSATEWDASAYVATSDGENDLVNVIKANSGDSWTVDFDGTSLVFTYTHVVPEPATWAAIFGALAMGLALLRRRAGRN